MPTTPRTVDKSAGKRADGKDWIGIIEAAYQLEGASR